MREELESVIIPEGVISIGELVFSECYNLGYAIIPDSVKSIGRRAGKQLTTQLCLQFKS